MAAGLRRAELLARVGVVVLALTAVGIPIVSSARTPLIHARIAEAGGWTPDALQATVDKPLHLRLTSDDVVHGFAVGQMTSPNVELLPGKVTDVTLLFDKPGTYVFYCTRWCGVNHWRMRGTIEVTGPAVATEPADVPLYVSLGLDLDAPRTAPALPNHKPTAMLASQQLASDLVAFETTSYYRSHSPESTWQSLRRKPQLAELPDEQLWNMTAWVWQSNTSAAGLAEAAQLYAQNCAACHGEDGGGDGVFAAKLAAGSHGPTGMGTQTPADFTNKSRILAASPALLQGKILRGGMGTGMPSWGQIFTENQSWDLVAYLYAFQFRYP